MRVHKLLFFIIIYLLPFIFPLTSAHAAEPFTPFSIEGNPPEDYYFDKIFPLFAYIRPPAFQVFENEDRSRGYEALKICTGSNALDTRDPYCNNNGDTCTGGVVNICYKDTGSFTYPAKSGPVSCDYYEDKDPEFPNAYREGECNYRKKPSISRTIMGTDFSAGDTPDEFQVSSFVYPKLQDEAARYSNQGDPANPISYGSHFLAYNLCERATHQLLVVARAKQTKTTVATTGEWPLGWVDWGYTTPNNKTLLSIHNSLPGSVSGAAQIIIEGIDDYYLNSAGIEVMSDISEPKQEFCQIYTSATANGKQWAVDLSQAPLYSPSFRQGYARSSICVWDVCCPGLRCPLDSGLNEKEGNSRSLYYDTSISQAFGGALDDLLFNYPLEEGAQIFQDIATNNPLIRFLTSASDQAIPSAVTTRLNQEMKGDQCFQLRTNPLRWIDFGYIFDYLNNYKFLDSEEKCPGYDIQGELTKEEGGAFATQSLISQIIGLLWNRPVDDVDPVKKHLITVPDAMGQSISDLQNHMYYTQDTLSEIEKQQEYNSSLSNIVDDQEGYLLAGKYGPVASSKRHLAHFSCSSSEYSSPQGTSILDYALGTRIGCSDTTTSDSTCDGAKFAKLISNYPFGTITTQGQQAFEGMQERLTPELIKIYAEASEETGVPCEVLAGIHFVESDLHPNASLVSGRKIGTPEPDAGGKVFGSLLETAVYAGEHLLGKVGGNLTDTKSLVTALSRYNGGGNSNCQPGYPWTIPYNNCPPQWEGEDDIYPLNWIDENHAEMYLLYCADHTACEPALWKRPGALTFAIAMYENMTKDGAIAGEITDTPLATIPSTPLDTIEPLPPFIPKSCGPNSLDTALGCLPYGDNLTSTLLTFLIGISGLVSLGVMLAGTIQIMTSAGDLEKTRKGRELFTAAIVGLLFIIFSVTLLQTFAGEIIKLPGF